MSDLIRRRRAVTTTQSSEPLAQPTSAATAPALMDHLAVGPAGQEEHSRAVSAVEDGEAHPGDQQSYQHRIRRVTSGCTDGGVA
ncbi:hypothetical protein Prudu_019338 [Prunus dulcis]|uniref:Uncharacterized protein n=1 Tax=Prunus dulcis TaxID=3755 RepID=A0A4Y1RU60_PRUDU|nr:hypothetical protein Prudu_019338 [Prunus dulcis]